MGEVRGQSEGAQSFITLPWHEACSNTPWQQLAVCPRVTRWHRLFFHVLQLPTSPITLWAAPLLHNNTHRWLAGRRGKPEQRADINHSLADNRRQMLIAFRLSLKSFSFSVIVETHKHEELKCINKSHFLCNSCYDESYTLVIIGVNETCCGALHLAKEVCTAREK